MRHGVDAGIGSIGENINGINVIMMMMMMEHSVEQRTDAAAG